MWLDRRRVGVRIILRTATAALAAVGAALWIRRRRARRGPKPAPGACAAARLRAVTLVLSDMDGTWLGSAHAPTAGGARARAEAEAAGLTFCFATGRCPASAQRASRVDLSRRLLALSHLCRRHHRPCRPSTSLVYARIHPHGDSNEQWIHPVQSKVST